MKRLLAVLGFALVAIYTMGAQAFELKEEPKIAFIYAASAQDGGWNEAFEAARMNLEKSLGMQIAFSESIPEEATAIRNAIDLYVQRGYNIIVGTGYGYSDGILLAADDHPDVAFLNAAGITNNSKNLESFYARTYEGWYLAGLIAGSMTNSAKLGMLAGFPIGLVNWDINAFIRGVRDSNENAEVIGTFTNSWWDPVKEGQIAEAMIQEGADVIATDLSAASVLNAAEETGNYSVGFQLDMSKHAPNGHLVSVIFTWDQYLEPTIRSIIDGPGSLRSGARSPAWISASWTWRASTRTCRRMFSTASPKPGRRWRMAASLPSTAGAEAGWLRCGARGRAHQRRGPLGHELLRRGRHRDHAHAVGPSQHCLCALSMTEGGAQ